MDSFKNLLKQKKQELEHHEQNLPLHDQLQRALQTFVQCLKNDHKIMAMGNGGSLCDAQHFCEELTGRYHKDRRPLAALCLNDSAHITCTANDYQFDQIYLRMLQALGKKGDVVLALSTSGNSQNIITASQWAMNNGMTVIGLTGQDGGKLGLLASIAIKAPAHFSARIQEWHITYIHWFIEEIEKNLLQ